MELYIALSILLFKEIIYTYIYIYIYIYMLAY